MEIIRKYFGTKISICILERIFETKLTIPEKLGKGCSFDFQHLNFSDTGERIEKQSISLLSNCTIYLHKKSQRSYDIIYELVSSLY